MNVDDGLEDIRWIRGLGERLPSASYALLPNLKNGLFFAIREGSRTFVVCFYTPVAIFFLYQTPGRCPPCITGRGANTVTRGWVGAPITSAPRSGFMTQSLVLSIDVCRGLGIPPLRMKPLAKFFSGGSWPNIWPGCFLFSLLFESLEHFL